MSMKRLLTLGYADSNGDSIFPFDQLFMKKQSIVEHGIQGCDAVVFWGGTDISPTIYNQKPHKRSQSTEVLSKRDAFEVQAMKICKARGIPMIGVCRGAQLMCAVDGGQLIQDVSGHGSPHDMTTKDGEIIITTSCHHQMMYPSIGQPFELLAWASHPLSQRYDIDSGPLDLKDFKEPEIIFFPRMKGIAIQGHPEWAGKNTRYVGYCLQVIKQYLLESENEQVC